MLVLAFAVILSCSFVETQSRHLLLIKGVPAEVGEFKGSISIQLVKSGSHQCGGTLVQLRHVVTAARSVTNSYGTANDPNMYRLMGGDLSIKEGASDLQVRYASDIFVHENYDAETRGNDVAVIRTKEPFTPTNNFNPVPIPDEFPKDDEEIEFFIASWGCTVVSEPASTTLMKLKVRLTNKQTCDFNCKGPIGTFCAGNQDPHFDFCEDSDYGSGLIYKEKFIGFASRTCAQIVTANIYTDAVYFRSWIELKFAEPSITTASTQIEPFGCGRAAVILNSIFFVLSSVIIVLLN